jgi:hypothetical protein
MEAICYSETWLDSQRTTRRYMPEDSILHNHGCENLKSYVYKTRLIVHEVARVTAFKMTLFHINV